MRIVAAVLLLTLTFSLTAPAQDAKPEPPRPSIDKPSVDIAVSNEQKLEVEKRLLLIENAQLRLQQAQQESENYIDLLFAAYKLSRETHTLVRSENSQSLKFIAKPPQSQPEKSKP